MTKNTKLWIGVGSTIGVVVVTTAIVVPVVLLSKKDDEVVVSTNETELNAFLDTLNSSLTFETFDDPDVANLITTTAQPFDAEAIKRLPLTASIISKPADVVLTYEFKVKILWNASTLGTYELIIYGTSDEVKTAKTRTKEATAVSEDLNLILSEQEDFEELVVGGNILENTIWELPANGTTDKNLVLPTTLTTISYSNVRRSGTDHSITMDVIFSKNQRRLGPDNYGVIYSNLVRPITENILAAYLDHVVETLTIKENVPDDDIATMLQPTLVPYVTNSKLPFEINTNGKPSEISIYYSLTQKAAPTLTSVGEYNLIIEVRAHTVLIKTTNTPIVVRGSSVDLNNIVADINAIKARHTIGTGVSARVEIAERTITTVPSVGETNEASILTGWALVGQRSQSIEYEVTEKNEANAEIKFIISSGNKTLELTDVLVSYVVKWEEVTQIIVDNVVTEIENDAFKDPTSNIFIDLSFINWLKSNNVQPGYEFLTAPTPSDPYSYMWYNQIDSVFFGTNGNSKPVGADITYQYVSHNGTHAPLTTTLKMVVSKTLVVADITIKKVTTRTYILPVSA